ncbi:hypothetical protein F5Y16DRAFT_415943 [Xylariaceae sp. FL0255]|nr:hypothetical protein F5Y16DRAFT_415943 [Xylariaceae sp. FL0255]
MVIENVYTQNNFLSIVGSLIIVTSFILDSIFSYAQKRWKYREYENIEWQSNQTLQLQRLAYEESGQGEWSRCLDAVPITGTDQELCPLNLADPEHPLLRQSLSPRPSKEDPMPTGFAHGHPANSIIQGAEELQGEDMSQNTIVSPTEFSRYASTSDDDLSFSTHNPSFPPRASCIPEVGHSASLSDRF